MSSTIGHKISSRVQETVRGVESKIDSVKKGQIIEGGGIAPKDGVVKKPDGTTEVKMTRGLDDAKVVITPGKSKDDPPKMQVQLNDGTRRDLTTEEKKRVAQELDRKVANGQLPAEEKKAAEGALDAMYKDPDISMKWDTPNARIDIAMREGDVYDIEKTNGTHLGRTVGPMQFIDITDGAAESRVTYEKNPGGTPIFSKTVKGQWDHQVKLTKDEAEALRETLKRSGPQKGETKAQYQDRMRDLERYIAAQEPTGDTEKFQRSRLLAVA